MENVIELEGFLRSFEELKVTDDEFLTFYLNDDLTQTEYDLISYFDGGKP